MSEDTALQPEIVKSDKQIVEEIVDRWNDMVTTLQNTTIQLCMMIQDMLKDYPTESIKNILDEVKRHPRIKRFVSIDRIWQGMRLVKNRPELIEYTKLPPEEQKEVSYKKRPYLKSDGTIFWEFYFELEKAPLNPLERDMLEIEGKEQRWSYRDLRNKIQERKDELESPRGEIYSRKQEKHDLIKSCAAMLRELAVEQLRDAKKLLEHLKKRQMEESKNGNNTKSQS